MPAQRLPRRAGWEPAGCGRDCADAAARRAAKNKPFPTPERPRGSRQDAGGIWHVRPSLCEPQDAASPRDRPVKDAASPRGRPVKDAASPRSRPVKDAASPRGRPVKDAASPRGRPVKDAASPARTLGNERSPLPLASCSDAASCGSHRDIVRAR
jgi:hypothetical protein